MRSAPLLESSAEQCHSSTLLAAYPSNRELSAKVGDGS
jgi:hypothetical protein